MSLVICLDDFSVETIGRKFHFEKGKKYKYKLDSLEFLCDEELLHMVNGIPLSKTTVNENFKPLQNWRDDQIELVL
jgi:hypothetical protein